MWKGGTFMHKFEFLLIFINIMYFAKGRLVSSHFKCLWFMTVCVDDLSDIKI